MGLLRLLPFALQVANARHQLGLPLLIGYLLALEDSFAPSTGCGDGLGDFGCPLGLNGYILLGRFSARLRVQEPFDVCLLLGEHVDQLVDLLDILHPKHVQVPEELVIPIFERISEPHQGQRQVLTADGLASVEVRL